MKKQVVARQAEGLSVSASAFGHIELRIISLLEKTDADADQEDGPSKSFVVYIIHFNNN